VSKKTADSLAMRNAIFRMEDVIKSIPGNGIEENGVRHVHHFAPGIYGLSCRSIRDRDGA
jgi:hypothetical protein